MVPARPPVAADAVAADAVVRQEKPSGPPPTNAEGETVCGERDLGPFRDGRVVDREIYSFPKINQLLARYPKLARSIGLDQVRDCADARAFTLRYQKFREAHPNFDDGEWPDKAAGFAR